MQLFDDGSLRSHLLRGFYSHNDKIFHMEGLHDTDISPDTSTLARKVVRELNKRGIVVKQVERSYFDPNTQDTEHEFYPRSSLTGQLPEFVYHGTNTKYIETILKIGIVPSPQNNNYRKVVTHYDKVFFTSKFEKAAYHAIHSAVRSDPVIIMFKIPDPNLLVPDFDIENVSNEFNLNASKASLDKFKTSMDPLKLSKETGIWGYKGSIRPGFFVKFFLRPEGWDEFITVTKEQLQNYIEYGSIDAPDFYEDDEDL